MLKCKHFWWFGKILGFYCSVTYWEYLTGMHSECQEDEEMETCKCRKHSKSLVVKVSKEIK